MDLEVIVTHGLGDNSYLLASEDEGLVVDPQRDIGRFLAAAQARGVAIRHVVETHVHNDYVSGALELREATGAGICAPARGGYQFPHHPMAEGDELKLGDLRLVALETPGHTPEHMAYLIHESGTDDPVSVFTGGSLMVGGAGRTDLLGAERTEELTRLQYRTLRRLAELPDAVQVLPTHGAGSFCGVGAAPKQRVSTLQEERSRNRALAAPDEERFLRQQLSDLLAYPDYYREMAPINRSGPRLLRDLPRPRRLSPQDLSAAIERGAWVLDGRFRVLFAKSHIAGSVNAELADDFASYVGWVVPFNASVALVLPEPEEEALEEAFTQLLRIGYERVEGYLAGGVEAWQASGRPRASYDVAGLEELCRAYRAGRVTHVLDVRQQVEWDRGSIQGSHHIFVGDLPDRLNEVPKDGEVWTICASGHRSALAASLLDREGIPVRLVEGTGVPDFLAHCQ